MKITDLKKFISFEIDNELDKYNISDTLSFDVTNTNYVILKDTNNLPQKYNKKIQKLFSDNGYKNFVFEIVENNNAIKIYEGKRDPKKIKANDVGLVGNQFTANQIRKKVLTYLSDYQNELDQIFDDLEKRSVTSLGILEFGSEGLEIFSAYNMVFMLSKHKKLRDQLSPGFPSSVGDYRVEFGSTNQRLYDYKISHSGSETPINVSVKNATTKSVPNTITPKNLFENKKELNDWHKKYGQSQFDQSRTFGGAMTLRSSPGKTNILYPLESIKKFSKREFVSMCERYLNQIKVREIKNQSRKEYLEKMYNYIKKLNVKSLSASSTIPSILILKEDYSQSVIDVLSEIGNKTKSKIDSRNVNKISTLSVFLENIFVEASKKNQKMNFKQMFEDRLINDKQIIFSSIKSLSGNRVVFESMGKYNFSRFSKKANWMELRSKNTYSSIGYGALGIDPRLK